MSPPIHTLTVAQRAALLRACHCEEKVIKGNMDFLKDQIRIGVKGAAEKLAVAEADLEILHSAIRALWLT